ncbi:P-loop NTPase fold protein [Mucilaginibacter sp.]|uniref:P-loop NTPase fold protein n=1 Tax=Mucilaginibacter sp. TaxID=1882438 RepID=UPI0025DBE3A3|nr:P-loop NTPase fold protein [Mucilaginibacter sp.]
MPNAKIPTVPTKSLDKSFDEHIRDDFNERILFSAPFGAGKSTFLKNYFDQQDDIIVLKLFPVNYSIAQNQDVFELIKYDLLYELLSKYPKEIQLEQEQYSCLLMSQMFLLHRMKIDLPLKLILKAAGTVTGTPIPEQETIDGITNLIGEFSEFKGKMNTSEWTQLNKYIQSFKNKTGHVHESDDITELIVDMLERVKIAKNGDDDQRKITTVLLIDDLDRLDPEHVFRLFNVFSAHYDEVTESNKFGFDKIIFVCDINNVQQMFAHRYGISVEFNGYIDKFYSSEVFNFDISQYLKDSLKALLMARHQLKKFFPDGLNQTYEDRFRLDKHDGFYSFLSYVITGLIDSQQIRIRNFQRFQYFALPNRQFKHRHREWHVLYYPLLVLVNTLERFFSRQAELENALKFLYENYSADYRLVTILERNRSDYDDQAHTLISYCLPFLLDPIQIFEAGFTREMEYTVEFKNEHRNSLYILYTVKESFESNYTWVNFLRCSLSGELTDGKNENPAVYKPNPFWFLYKAYKNIKANRYI